MNAVSRLREQGFEVWLETEQRIAVKPIHRLPEHQAEWMKKHRQQVVTELLEEAAIADQSSELRKCSECRYEKLSAHNPAGGLTSCAIRNDVPLMMPGTRERKCSTFCLKL